MVKFIRLDAIHVPDVGHALHAECVHAHPHLVNAQRRPSSHSLRNEKRWEAIEIGFACIAHPLWVKTRHTALRSSSRHRK